MRSGCFACLLVVLACHEAMPWGMRQPSLLIGNCDFWDPPKEVRESCSRIECNKDAEGRIEFTAIPCPPLNCENGKTPEWKEAFDPSEMYPGCCPQLVACN